ncbi:MAG TPA: nucleoside phosphorylase [Cyclobacteriaceae bacterium]|jgi:uridine phosphorylase
MPISETNLILNSDGSVYHLNLKPEDIADTIIAVGDPSRVYSVSNYFDDVDFEMNRREFITHTGRYKGKKVTVISTGIGTDNIEIFFTEIDALVNIDLKTREVKTKKNSLKIIRVGTSGALQEDIPVDSHLASENAIGIDSLMCFYNLPQNSLEQKLGESLKVKLSLPYAPYVVSASKELFKKFGKDMLVGNTVTCPGFYAPQGRKVRLDLKIPNLFNEMNYFHENGMWLTNFEMETAAYYAFGRLMGHETLSLNAIIANRITNKFSKDPEKSVDSLIRKVLDRI